MVENTTSAIQEELKELRRSVMKAEVDSERTHYITRFVVPILSAIVIGLFSWIWATSQHLIKLQADIDKAASSAADRYTQTEADRDLPKIDSWLKDNENNLDEVRVKKLPKIMLEITVLKTKLKHLEEAQKSHEKQHQKTASQPPANNNPKISTNSS